MAVKKELPSKYLRRAQDAIDAADFDLGQIFAIARDYRDVASGTALRKIDSARNDLAKAFRKLKQAWQGVL